MCQNIYRYMCDDHNKKCIVCLGKQKDTDQIAHPWSSHLFFAFTNSKSIISRPTLGCERIAEQRVCILTDLKPCIHVYITNTSLIHTVCEVRETLACTRKQSVYAFFLIGQYHVLGYFL